MEEQKRVRAGYVNLRRDFFSQKIVPEGECNCCSLDICIYNVTMNIGAGIELSESSSSNNKKNRIKKYFTQGCCDFRQNNELVCSEY